MRVCTRTIINLPDGLAESGQASSRRPRTDVHGVVEEGLRTVLANRLEHDPPRELPAYGDPAAHFLVDPADRPARWDALDADGAR